MLLTILCPSVLQPSARPVDPFKLIDASGDFNHDGPAQVRSHAAPPLAVGIALSGEAA